MRRRALYLTIVLLVCSGGTACRVEVPATPPAAPTTGGQSAGTEYPSAATSADTPDDVAGRSASEIDVAPPETAPEPPAEATPRSGADDQAAPITFDDLKLEMEQDTVFDPAMLTERVKQLDGRRVRIRGFIFPSVFQQTGITHFPLIMSLECKFGPGGQAHHIVIVEMKPDRSTSFTVRPVAVEGILTVRPWNGPDGNTWALYHILGEKVD